MQSGDKHGKAMHFKQFESMLTFRMSVLQHTFSKRLTLSKRYVVTYEPSQVELFKMHCFTMFVTNLCLNFLMKFSTFLRVSSLSVGFLRICTRGTCPRCNDSIPFNAYFDCDVKSVSLQPAV